MKPDPYSALDKLLKHTHKGRKSGRSFTLLSAPHLGASFYLVDILSLSSMIDFFYNQMKLIIFFFIFLFLELIPKWNLTFWNWHLTKLLRKQKPKAKHWEIPKVCKILRFLDIWFYILNFFFIVTVLNMWPCTEAH